MYLTYDSIINISHLINVLDGEDIVRDPIIIKPEDSLE